MTVTPVAAAPIEHPGGAEPRIGYPVTLPPGRTVSVSVVAAPGLAVRGTRRQRLALSIDDGAPVPIDLLAGYDDSHWRRAVSDNRRIATATPPVGRAGPHALHLWLVDPQVILKRLEIEPALKRCRHADYRYRATSDANRFSCHHRTPRRRAAGRRRRDVRARSGVRLSPRLAARTGIEPAR